MKSLLGKNWFYLEKKCICGRTLLLDSAFKGGITLRHVRSSSSSSSSCVTPKNFGTMQNFGYSAKSWPPAGPCRSPSWRRARSARSAERGARSARSAERRTPESARLYLLVINRATHGSSDPGRRFIRLTHLAAQGNLSPRGALSVF